MKGNTNAIVVTEGAPTGDFKVKVIDYDGTVIEEIYKNYGDEYTLPTPPTHSGLTFQEWNSPHIISDGKITVVDDVLVGAVYTTTSGDTEFDIELTPASGLTVNFRMNGTKDWGDGTSDSDTTHVYSTYGEYTIKCESGSMNTSSTYGLFGQDTSSTDTVGNTTLKAVRFGTGVTQIGQYAFMKCNSLRSVSISTSVTSLGNYSFSSSSNIRAIVLPSTLYNTSTSGNYIGSYAFAYSRELKDIVISKGYTFLPGYFLRGCATLKEVIIPASVSTAGFYQYCLAECFSLEKVVILGGPLEPASYSFYQSYALKDVDLLKFKTKLYQYMFVSNYELGSELEFIGVTQLDQYLFGGCYNVRKIKFNSNVTSIADNAFNSCRSIEEYNFKANTSVPVLGGTNAFNQINKLCKIKVPWDLYRNWIAATNWSSLINYIDGGTPATITFTGDTSSVNIYVDNNLISGTTINWVGSNMPYRCYDSTNNILLPTQTLTGITEASSQTVNIDLSSKSKITLSVGVTDLEVKFTIDGKTYDATNDNGDYYIYVIGSGTTIDYYIDGGDNYMDASGTVTTTGSDITESVTLIEAVEEAFTRPNLSSNGTLGGSSFAVTGYTNYNSSSYPPYKAVDSSSTSYWYGQAWESTVDGVTTRYSPRFIFYNPDKLKVSQLVLTYYNNSYTGDLATLQGSNDNSHWDLLETSYSLESLTGTLTVTSPKYYLYYKVGFNDQNTGRRIQLADLGITAVKKVPAN